MKAAELKKIRFWIGRYFCCMLWKIIRSCYLKIMWCGCTYMTVQYNTVHKAVDQWGKILGQQWLKKKKQTNTNGEMTKPWILNSWGGKKNLEICLYFKKMNAVLTQGINEHSDQNISCPWRLNGQPPFRIQLFKDNS